MTDGHTKSVGVGVPVTTYPSQQRYSLGGEQDVHKLINATTTGFLSPSSTHKNTKKKKHQSAR